MEEEIPKSLSYKNIFCIPGSVLINHLHIFKIESIPYYSIKKIENVSSLLLFIL